MVGIATRLTRWRVRGPIPGRSKISLLKTAQTGSGAHPVSYDMGIGFLLRS